VAEPLKLSLPELLCVRQEVLLGEGLPEAVAEQVALGLPLALALALLLRKLAPPVAEPSTLPPVLTEALLLPVEVMQAEALPELLPEVLPVLLPAGAEALLLPLAEGVLLLLLLPDRLPALAVKEEEEEAEEVLQPEELPELLPLEEAVLQGEALPEPLPERETLLQAEAVKETLGLVLPLRVSVTVLELLLQPEAEPEVLPEVVADPQELPLKVPLGLLEREEREEREKVALAEPEGEAEARLLPEREPEEVPQPEEDTVGEKLAPPAGRSCSSSSSSRLRSKGSREGRLRKKPAMACLPLWWGGGCSRVQCGQGPEKGGGLRGAEGHRLSTCTHQSDVLGRRIASASALTCQQRPVPCVWACILPLLHYAQYYTGLNYPPFLRIPEIFAEHCLL
jgi:hypothetical protein